MEIPFQTRQITRTPPSSCRPRYMPSRPLSWLAQRMGGPAAMSGGRYARIRSIRTSVKAHCMDQS